MRLAASIVTLVCLAAVAPAHAQVFSRHRGASSFQLAYDNGYREGIDRGERDRRAGRAGAFDHDTIYRRGDRGYHRQYGDRETYRQAFREGFAAGYNQSYYGTSGGRERAVPRRSPGAGYPGTSPAPYPSYPSYPGYPTYPSSPTYPGYPTNGPYGSSYGGGAFDTGYADGYDKGVDDGRDRDRYDPLRHSRFRSADHGYDRRYGSRDEYKNIYREGFRQGYDRGYRDAQTYGSQPRNRWGLNWPWPF